MSGLRSVDGRRPFHLTVDGIAIEFSDCWLGLVVRYPYLLASGEFCSYKYLPEAGKIEVSDKKSSPAVLGKRELNSSTVDGLSYMYLPFTIYHLPFQIGFNLKIRLGLSTPMYK